MKRLALLFVLLFVAGCAAPKREPCPLLPWNARGTVADVRQFPQDPMVYAQGLSDWPAPSQQALQQAYEAFRQRHFAPWRQKTSGYSRSEALWAVQAYGNRQGFGENLRPRDASWFKELTEAVTPEAFPSLAQRAIAVRNTSLRSMPTHKPFFYDPSEAGEGFPFDYFQNSALWAGTPMFISHQSADGGWLYAEAPFAAGWVPVEDLARVDETFIQQWQGKPLEVVLRDNVPVRAAGGDFLFSAHLGTLLPRMESGAGKVLAPVRTARGEAVLREAVVSGTASAPFPLPLSPQRVAELARGLMGQSYGWGGLYENRDCSATTRDLLTPFGIWLPRNSKPQARAGRHISLEGLSTQQKEKRLLQEGIPFRTLVGQPGHIMLYLGEYDGRAMLLHTIWGLRTEDECGRTGRQVIGRTVITTLTPGRELEAVQRSGYSLQQRIDSLAVLPE